MDEVHFPDPYQRRHQRTNGKVAALAAKFGYHYIDCNDGIKDEKGNQKAEFSKEGIHMYPTAYVEVFKSLLQYL